MRRREKHDSLRRPRHFRIPRPRFLIVCEGEVTEPDYFREIRHLERSIIELEIIHEGKPKPIVDRAIEKKKEAERAAKREGNGYLRYDQVWCVFDVDDHPLITEAAVHARNNAIRVAISNPCFELWALLHFRDQRAFIGRDSLHHECGRSMPGYEKHLPTAKLHPLTDEALRRARELEEWQVSRGCDGVNPSTGVHRLMAEIRKARPTR